MTLVREEAEDGTAPWAAGIAPGDGGSFVGLADGEAPAWPAAPAVTAGHAWPASPGPPGPAWPGVVPGCQARVPFGPSAQSQGAAEAWPGAYGARFPVG